MRKRTSSYRERLLEDLRDPQEAANYVNAAIEDRSPEMLLLALRDVAEAHTMSKVAKGTGVAREAIYRILSEKGNPRLSSFWNLFPTLGLELFVRPSGPKRKPRVRRERPVSQNAATKLRQSMRIG
jgi:probable addiction module antidote protein